MTFNQKLSSSLKDETSAAKTYTKMINMTSNNKIKQILTEIRNDELDHHKKLEIIKDMVR